MWKDAIDAGGPVMYAVVAAWVVVLAGVLERGAYAMGRALRRPHRRVHELFSSGRADAALALALEERGRAARTIRRIDSVSQLATSLGLFGTVLGIAQGFLARGRQTGDTAASLSALGDGLSTALFTTIAGLAVFLFGQLALIVYREWLEGLDRTLPLDLAASLDVMSPSTGSAP